MTVARLMRAPVRRYLVGLIGGQTGGAVTVERGFPGPNLEADQIYITGTRGTPERRVFAAGSLPTDDLFTISFLCVAGSVGRELDQAEDVAESFANMVMNAVDAAEIDNFTVGNGYVISAELGECSDYSAGRQGGFASFYSVDVDVHTRTNYTGADAQ